MSKLIDEEYFLCQTFSKSISSNHFNNEQLSMKIDFSFQSTTTTNEWNVGDACLCPFSEDGLLYKATITNISSNNCSVRFDDYGNEEEHLLEELKHRNNDENQIDEEEILPPVDRSSEIPSIPFPQFPSIDQNENLSSTLMSWYLAGYHTGYYQAMKEKNSS